MDAPNAWNEKHSCAYLVGQSHFLFILTTVIQILFFFETYLICIMITPFFVVVSMHFLLFVFRKDRTKISEINTIRVTLPFLISITSSLLFYFSRILYRIDFSVFRIFSCIHPYFCCLYIRLNYTYFQLPY